MACYQKIFESKDSDDFCQYFYEKDIFIIIT